MSTPKPSLDPDIRPVPLKGFMRSTVVSGTFISVEEAEALIADLQEWVRRAKLPRE